MSVVIIGLLPKHWSWNPQVIRVVCYCCSWYWREGESEIVGIPVGVIGPLIRIAWLGSGVPHVKNGIEFSWICPSIAAVDTEWTWTVWVAIEVVPSPSAGIHAHRTAGARKQSRSIEPESHSEDLVERFTDRGIQPHLNLCGCNWQNGGVSFCSGVLIVEYSSSSHSVAAGCQVHHVSEGHFSVCVYVITGIAGKTYLFVTPVGSCSWGVHLPVSLVVGILVGPDIYPYVEVDWIWGSCGVVVEVESCVGEPEDITE